MRPHAVASAALLAIVTAGSIAAQNPAGEVQQPPPAEGLVKKGRAPVSDEVLRVKLPKPQQATLPNGLQLIVLEDRRLPRISFQIIIPGAGGYYDPAEVSGLSSFTAQLMREGTKSRTSQQISQELETIAATLGVAGSIAGPNASVSGAALTENFDRLFELAADVLVNPAFAAEEWDRLRPRAQQGLVQQRSNPNFLSTELFSRVLYGNHPAGRVSPTPATLAAIAPEAMIDFHRTRFVPDHAVIAFAGDISLAEARKKVDAMLGAWKKAGTPGPAVEEPPAPGPAKVYLVARPASVQTTLVVGGPSIRRVDPDYIPLTVANRVLGGPMGRLFRHLREQKGYTYGIGSGFSATLHRGSWQASTSVRTDVTDPALTDLLGDIRQMSETPVSDAELADARRAIVAGFARSLENPQQMLGYYMDSWMYSLPADYWDKYPEYVAAVTPEQVKAAAKKYWDPARLHIVAVGDASAISDALRKKGELEVYDVEGNPIK